MRRNDELIARDRKLPGLGVLLDDAALTRALGVPRITRGRLRYKPGVSCTLAVDLGQGDWRCLRALTPARHAVAAARGKGAGPAALSEQSVLCLDPRDDRKVHGLKRFWPDDRRAKALSALFGEGRLADAGFEPISYRPERRLVARLTHPLGDGLLKIHAQAAFARAQAGALVAAALGHGTLRAADPRHGVVVCNWAPGRMLDPCGRTDETASGFAETGRALAQIHSAALEVPTLRTRHAEFAALRAIASDTARLLPELSERLHAAASSIEGLLAGCAGDIGLLHGDFSADQVVLDQAGSACVVDWDRACMGDRAADLGSALARLDLDLLQGRMTAAQADVAETALLDGYRMVRDLPAAMPVQRLLHQFLLLTDPFRMQALDWQERTARLLQAVERGLAACDRPSGDPALPDLAAMLDPVCASAALRAIGAGALSRAPRLMRHKKGRRAMVELHTASAGAGQGAWLAKLRARKPDHATPALHHALRAAGFDGTPGRAFGVPAAFPGPDGARFWIMQRVPGTLLSDFQQPHAATEAFARTGQALAAFHDALTCVQRCWNQAQELAVLDKALESAIARHPQEAHRITRLRAAVTGMPQGSRPPAVLLHRDFYPDQVLIDAETVWMLDLDLAARGDRHVDVGNFLAHLDEFALRTFGDAGALAAHGAAFLSGYRAGGGQLSEPALARARLVSLMRHLDICARFPDRADRFPVYLAHLEQALAGDGSDARLAS